MKANNKATKKHHNGWLTDEIVNQGEFLRQLFKAHKVTNDEELKKLYNILLKNH